MNLCRYFPSALLPLLIALLHIATGTPLNLSTYLTGLPSNTSIAALSLPGTHNTLAHSRTLDPFTRCQHHPLPHQLSIGIRFLDLRLRLRSKTRTLVAHHGAIPLGTTFTSAMADIDTFLSRNPGEFVLVRIQLVGRAGTAEFGELLRRDLGMRWWGVGGRGVPRLGEVRGRVVVVQDFDDGRRWGLNWNYRKEVIVQDQWRIRGWGVRRKLAAVETFWKVEVPKLRRALAVRGHPKLLVSFLSASGTMTPRAVAERIWPAWWCWWHDWEGPAGVVAGDFMTQAVSRRIVEKNFLPGGPGEGVDVEMEREKWIYWKQEE